MHLHLLNNDRNRFIYYKDESKVLQSFGNVGHSSPASNAFFIKAFGAAELCPTLPKKLQNLWRWWSTLDCEMLSSPDTLWMLLTRFFYMAWNTASEFLFLGQPWSCPLVGFLVTSAKFLKLFSYCSVINCTLTFHTTNIFGYICGIMAQFKVVKNKFLN